MLDIILILVFSIVMLVFMAFPAMRIAQWLESKEIISPSWHTISVITLTIGLSLVIGLFLKFA
ncbi:MAG: hypothetical protein LGB07_07120 [Sulfurovum sp.]|nr:hypothetical protein [Sulfurovum sp.]MCB4746557.1 hypothetical protein [Sulfurovum sp.]MCB4749728.1 hypothetical protein [Sulfurovum sp.]MCB4750354.1 hypothetical protein [Sulfurovum sp.]MCB4754667.1 hypothetical protein [Sulfurovum sp.]